MESTQRGRIPWSLVVVLGAGFTWACSGEALHMMGDAAVDLGEAMRDASCALAQDDGGACEPGEPAHGSVDVVCDQEATWTPPGQPERTRTYALVDVPTRNVQVERCGALGPCGSDCVGTPPPDRTCALDQAEFVGERAYVECDQNRTYRVIW